MSSLTKNQTAEALKVSPRAVERYVAAGKLAGFYERGKTGQVLMFDGAEVERFKAELNAPVQRGTVSPDTGRQSATEAPTEGGATRSDSPDSKALARLVGGRTPEGAALVQAVRVLAELAGATGGDRGRQAPSVPVESKLLLSLAEAQALTGLSRQTLRGAIDEKKLKARQIGRSWRIKRHDLEMFVEKL